MYAAGGFNFPTSTGNFAVTGLGFQPLGMLLFGSNRPELDTQVTGLASPGMFLTIVGPHYSSGALMALCVAHAGKSAGGTPGYAAIQTPTGVIRMMPDSAGGAASVEYRADTISFDPDGFTIHVTNAAPGVRPVHWMAFGDSAFDVIPVLAAAMRQNIGGGPFTPANGMTGLSTFVLGTVINSGGSFTEGGLAGQAWFRFGSGHYPALSAGYLDWKSSTIFTEIIDGTALGRQGFTEQTDWTGAGISDHNTSHVVSTVGPAFIEGYRRFRPSSLGAAQFESEGGGQANEYEFGLWWNGEGWTEIVGLPAAAATVSVPAPPNIGTQFQLVLFSHVNGGSPNTGGSAVQRFGMGVLHRDYQGCVSYGNDGSFYQSKTKAVAQVSASALKTSVGDFPTAHFRLTGVDGAGGGQAMWHGFGGPLKRALWIPQSYRFLKDRERPPIKL